MNERPTLLEAVDKLSAVGNADQIALYLEERGITGHIGNARTCAVSNYLRRETGLDVVSGPSRIRVDYATSLWPEIQKVNLRAGQGSTEEHVGISEFISNFDRCYYRALIDTDTEGD